MDSKTAATIVCAAALALAGCDAPHREAARETPKPIAKHVVLIGVDGFGAQYVPWDKMPNFKSLCDNGLYAVGRCGFPTASAINWASTFFGTTVELHGYRNWNSKKPDVSAWRVTEKGIPKCIYRAIREQDPDAYTVSLFTWDGIGHCQDTNAASLAIHFPGPGRDGYPPRDAAVFDEGIKQLAKRPKFMLLYQGQVDSWGGHGNGWGSEAYTNSCANVDANIGRLLEALKKEGMWDDTVVMLIADHGGEGKAHGAATLPCFEIPFMVSGPAVKGMRLREPVMGMDVAPTIAEILGYEIPEEWRGRPALVNLDGK